jgi:hypothetical protein
MPTGSRSGESGQREGLAEALEQLRATREVLRTLGRSGSTLDEVFRTVVERAKRLCRGDVAQMHLTAPRGTYRLAMESGLTEEYMAFMAEHPISADRRTLVGRVGIDRRAQQIADVLADPEYGAIDAQRLGRYRSIIGAPMLVDELGRVGLTAVGDSPSDADARYRRAEEVLLAEARAALTPRGLPAA